MKISLLFIFFLSISVALFGIYYHYSKYNKLNELPIKKSVLKKKSIGDEIKLKNVLDDKNKNELKREMIIMDNFTHNDSESIVIMQYNVLADAYTSPDRYKYCPSKHLEWEYRGPNIVQEILAYQPDFVCLQEVDKFEWFDEALQSEGYKGLYLKRPGSPDGCAIFYKDQKFQLINSTPVNFNSLEGEFLDSNKFGLTALRYRKGNVALITLFKRISDSTIFSVSSVHIYWDPKFSDVKLRQSHMLLKEISKFLKNTSNNSTPVIICGDFNSMPHSSVYQLYSRGEVSGQHADMLHLKTNEVFTTNLKLNSACAPLGEPLTNITPWFKGTLDYIWYSDNISLGAVVEPINGDDDFIRLPSSLWPSDHASLVAKLGLNSPSKNI